MTEQEIRMLDTENAAKDRYEYDKRLLSELNAGNIDWVKTIIREDMKIYEDDSGIFHHILQFNIIL